MQEIAVQFLGQEDPLEKGKATHSSILAWRIPWTVWSMESQRVGHDWEIFTFILKMEHSKILVMQLKLCLEEMYDFKYL